MHTVCTICTKDPLNMSIEGPAGCIIVPLGQMHLYPQGFLQARFGGGESPKKISYSPPKIFTDFIFYP